MYPVIVTAYGLGSIHGQVATSVWDLYRDFVNGPTTQIPGADALGRV